MENENILYFKDKLYDKLFDTMKKKEVTAEILLSTMNCRTLEMFEWKGLPTTIPQNVLEMQIQMQGFAIIFKHKEKMFSCWGNIGGIRNYNYLPKMAIVANPYISSEKSSFNLKIYYGKDDYESDINKQVIYDGDCVVIPNDGLYRGIRDLNSMYACELAETKLTKRVLTIVTRAMQILFAADDDQKEDFEELIESLENGDIKSIVDSDMTIRSQMLQYGENAMRDFTSLIENEQYIKASWFNDLGLQANYNMKREAINSNESQLNKDAIIPFADNMLKMRKEYCKKVNELFGTNWSVDFSSAWKQSRIATEEALDNVDGIEGNTETGNENTPNQLGVEGGNNETERISE